MAAAATTKSRTKFLITFFDFHIVGSRTLEHTHTHTSTQTVFSRVFVSLAFLFCKCIQRVSVCVLVLVLLLYYIIITTYGLGHITEGWRHGHNVCARTYIGEGSTSHIVGLCHECKIIIIFNYAEQIHGHK